MDCWQPSLDLKSNRPTGKRSSSKKHLLDMSLFVPYTRQKAEMACRYCLYLLQRTNFTVFSLMLSVLSCFSGWQVSSAYWWRSPQCRLQRRLAAVLGCMAGFERAGNYFVEHVTGSGATCTMAGSGDDHGCAGKTPFDQKTRVFRPPICARCQSGLAMRPPLHPHWPGRSR